VDANVSVRPEGSEELGAKTEIKNVNSFSGVEKAIEMEIARQVEVLEAGGRIATETLLWDDHKSKLRSMRSKEESHDYRYFPEPDLPPLRVPAEAVEAARAAVPELPRARKARLAKEYGLSEYEAGVLTQGRHTADYFEAVAKVAGDAKASANWVMGPVQALMNERKEDARSFTVPPDALAELVVHVADGTISDSAAKTVLSILAEEGGRPADVIEAKGLRQVRDDAQLDAWVQSAIDEHASEVDRYRMGESKLLGFLMGQVMRRSHGAADPRRVNELLRKKLSDG